MSKFETFVGASQDDEKNKEALEFKNKTEASADLNNSNDKLFGVEIKRSKKSEKVKKEAKIHTPKKRQPKKTKDILEKKTDNDELVKEPDIESGIVSTENLDSEIYVNENSERKAFRPEDVVKEPDIEEILLDTKEIENRIFGTDEEFNERLSKEEKKIGQNLDDEAKLVDKVEGFKTGTRKETVSSEFTDRVVREAKNRFSIKKEDLNKLDGFGNLSEGQQLWVIDSLGQLTLKNVREESSNQYSQKVSKTNFFGRIWLGIKKDFEIAKLGKSEAEKAVSGGIDFHKETLSQLIEGVKGQDLKVKIVEGGKLEAQYLNPEHLNLSEEEKIKIGEFNKIATEFSRMPEEYSFGTADGKSKNKYNEVRCGYDKKVEEVLVILHKHGSSDSEAMLYMNTKDREIKLNQFLNISPDAEKELTNMKEKSAWSATVGKVLTERVIYAGVGALTRTISVAMPLAVGASFGAALAGGIFSVRRASGELKEREIKNRKGVEDKSGQAKNFIDCAVLEEKLLDSMNKLKSADVVGEERKKIVNSLKMRIDYTQDKISKGLVNWGGNNESIGNRYSLIKKLSEVAIQSSFFEGDNEKRHQLELKLGGYLMWRDKRINKNQRNYIIKQGLKGAGIAAGCAFAGYAIRHFAGEWFGGGKDKQIDVKNTEKPISGKRLEYKIVKTPIEDKFTGVEAVNDKINSPKIGGSDSFKEKGPAEILGREVLSAKEKVVLPKGAVGGIESESEKLYSGVVGSKGIEGMKEVVPSSVQEVVTDVASKITDKESLGKLIGYELTDKNSKLINGLFKIKDFHAKGFDLIVDTKTGKFGVDGPAALGRYNWGSTGKSWLLKIDADMTKDNLDKAVEMIKKMNDSFYKPTKEDLERWS